MNIRRFRALHAAGATYAEIARECGCDWRTVRKYLAEDAVSAPPAAPPQDPAVCTAVDLQLDPLPALMRRAGTE